MGQIASTPRKALQRMAASFQGATSKQPSATSTSSQQQQQQQRWTDPHATIAGFTRGQYAPNQPASSSDEFRARTNDSQQQAFLQQQQQEQDAMNGNHSSSNNSSKRSPNMEMPADLIQFLQNVGPLKPQPNQGNAFDGSKIKRTTRHWDRQLEPLESSTTATKTTTMTTTRDDVGQGTGAVFGKDPSRRSQPMPLFQDVTGLNTIRTMNFSQQSARELESSVNDRILTLDAIDMYELLAMASSSSTKTIAGKGRETPPGTLAVAKTFWENRVATTQQQQQQQQPWSPQEQAEQERLLQQTMDTLQLPELWQDVEDESYYAVPATNIDPPNAMAASHPDAAVPTWAGIFRPVPSNPIQLVLEDLHHLDQQYNHHSKESQTNSVR